MRRVSLGTFEPTPPMMVGVMNVLASGRLSYGALSREFETKFAERHGCAYGVLSNSGTSSLVVALQAMKSLYGWADGDEVIVPALTFVATINAVIHCRLKPVFVDVHPGYHDLSLAYTIGAITPRTRCIMVANLFGKPASLPPLRDICDRHNLKLLEDSCETVGVSFDGKPVGSWGDIGVFSFYMAHILVAGVGGMATTNDPELALKMRSLVNHGIDVASLPNGQSYDPSWLARHFLFTEAGHSFRMTEMEAAIGLCQLEELDKIVAARQERAKWWFQLLEGVSGHLQMPKVRKGSESSWMMMPLVLLGEPAQPLREYLAERGVESRSLLPLVTQPYLQGMINPGDFPIARFLSDNGFYVGCHQGLKPADIGFAADAIAKYVTRRRPNIAVRIGECHQ